MSNELKKVLDKLDSAIDKFIASTEPNLVGTELEKPIQAFKEGVAADRAEYEKRKRERVGHLQKCHPEGERFQLDPDCPACQKMFDKLFPVIEKEAIAASQNPNDIREVEAKFKEIMLKRYGIEVTFHHEEIKSDANE